MSLKEDFLRLRRELIEKEYSRLNDMQRKAVLAPDCPLLILAGAGSGKTTVIVEKIAYLLRYGDAYNSDEVCCEPTEADVAELRAHIENGAELSERVKLMLSVDAPKPWQVLAITFTNKAAAELKERIALSCGEQVGADVWAATFHSACVRILRREIELLGYNSSFTIYDSDDSKRVIKDAVKSLELDDYKDTYKDSFVLNCISNAKVSFISPDEYERQNYGNVFCENIAKIYKAYSDSLKKSNALDFDDIIVLTVKLFREHPDVLLYWQNRFRRVFVDEYQDTSIAQFELVHLLTQNSRSLCVVGDDDQSIYKFRGATIRNILDFQKNYKDAIVIRLEQNYRSTKNILAVANKIISNNKERMGKKLWTENSTGDKVKVKTCYDAKSEGDYVAECIMKHHQNGGKLSDCAVLYRINALSASIEQSFIRYGIQHRIIGGQKFYERKEIKDIISYFYVITNPFDDTRLKRIINTPKRGIGNSTVETLDEISKATGEPIISLIRNVDDYPKLQRSSGNLKKFCCLLDDLSDKVRRYEFEDAFDIVVNGIDYINMLENENDERADDRIDNVYQLKEQMREYKNEVLFSSQYDESKERDASFELYEDSPTLSGFLESRQLSTDIDNYNKDDDAVVLMTMHNSKGLEFDDVFMIGMDNEIFPSNRSSASGEKEEERRLMYVGVTRAKKRLFLTHAQHRMLYGNRHGNEDWEGYEVEPSCFLSELPEEYIEKTDTLPKRTAQATHINSGSFGGSYGSSSYAGRSSYIGGGQPKRPAPRAAAEAKPKVTFAAGDTVRHGVFGEGRVVSAIPMGGDTLLEVEFAVGKKKLMAKFAPIEKV